MTHEQTKRQILAALDEIDAETSRYAFGYIHGAANVLYAARAISAADLQLFRDIAFAASCQHYGELEEGVAL